jgi:hypothetical protein
MNTGLQDASNLSWKIAEALKGHGSSALLDSYHDKCRPSGQRILKCTYRLFSVMASQSAWVASLRNHLLPLLAETISKSGHMRARAFHFMSQLGIRYEGDRFLRDEVSPDAPATWKEGLIPGCHALNVLITENLDVLNLTKRLLLPSAGLLRKSIV